MDCFTPSGAGESRAVGPYGNPGHPLRVDLRTTKLAVAPSIATPRTAGRVPSSFLHVARASSSPSLVQLAPSCDHSRLSVRHRHDGRERESPFLMRGYFFQRSHTDRLQRLCLTVSIRHVSTRTYRPYYRSRRSVEGATRQFPIDEHGGMEWRNSEQRFEHGIAEDMHAQIIGVSVRNELGRAGIAAHVATIHDRTVRTVVGLRGRFLFPRRQCFVSLSPLIWKRDGISRADLSRRSRKPRAPAGGPGCSCCPPLSHGNLHAVACFVRSARRHTCGSCKVRVEVGEDAPAPIRSKWTDAPRPHHRHLPGTAPRSS